MQFLKILIIAISFFDLNSFEANASQIERREKKIVNLGIKTIPKGEIDPLHVLAADHVIITQALFQSLVRVNGEGEISPSVAKKWSFSDDLKTITFYLDDIFFHDGTKLTARDVAFSISRHVWSNSVSVDKNTILNLFSNPNEISPNEIHPQIKIVSEKELSFKLKAPYPGLLPLLSISNLSIINEKAFYKDNYIGSGPYLLKNKNTEFIDLEIYENFNLEKPKNNSIRIVAYNESKNIMPNLTGNKVDTLFLRNDTDLVEEIDRSNFYIQKMETPQFIHLFTGSKKGFLGNKEIRKDFKKLISNFSHKTKNKNTYQEAMNYLIPKGLLPKSYYDVKDDFLDPIQFKEKYSITETYNILVQEGMCKTSFYKELVIYLEKSGIKTKLIVYDREKFLRNIFNPKNIDLIIASYAADFPDIDGMLPAVIGSGGFLIGNYPVEKFIKRHVEIKNISDQNLRLQKYSLLIKDFEAESYVFPMLRDHTYFIYRKGIVLPSSNYRYESEFWKVFWNK